MTPTPDTETLTKLYADVGGIAKVPDALLPCLPRSKFDEAPVQEAARRGYPAVEPILSHLLMWLQDLNWPVSDSVGSFLRSVGEPLAEPIRRVLRSRDDVWKQSVLTVLVKGGPLGLAWALTPDLRRIAEHPSEGEVAEGVPEVAAEILRHFAPETAALMYVQFQDP